MLLWAIFMWCAYAFDVEKECSVENYRQAVDLCLYKNIIKIINK